MWTRMFSSLSLQSKSFHFVRLHPLDASFARCASASWKRASTTPTCSRAATNTFRFEPFSEASSVHSCLVMFNWPSVPDSVKKDFFCHFLLSNYFLLTLVKQNVFSTLWNNIKIWYLNILLVSIIFNLVYIYGKLLIRVIRWKPDITTNHGFSTEKNKLSKKFFLIFFKNLIFAVLAASTLLYLATLSKIKRNQQPYIIWVIV